LLNVANVDSLNVMNVEQTNHALLGGKWQLPGVLPRLKTLQESSVVFDIDFGLTILPRQPGVLVIRGARQYGKSTWLEGAIRDTLVEYGPGTALFLDGDHLRDVDHLAAELSNLAGSFAKHAPVKRLFIDEITAVEGWERAVKRVWDRGELRDVLVVTTGSHAGDLRHGTERLPGRRGRLARSDFLFTPLGFAEFEKKLRPRFGSDILAAYLLSGGSPMAGADLAANGRLSEWVLQSTRDWILGEIARHGRTRRNLVAVMQQLHIHGGTALGQTQLAREAGLANNSVAAAWIDVLTDLLCVGVAAAWDSGKKREIMRKPSKFPFINLLAAAAWDPDGPRSPQDLAALAPQRRGVWFEWAVAQELFRRAAIAGQPEPERLAYWQSAHHEVDYICSSGPHVEVKLGKASALDFAWYRPCFAKAPLTVICSTPFATEQITGVTLATFLRGEAA
jgi:predicted AAA+ superfamily ATPase